MTTVWRASPEEVIDVRHQVLREGRPRETAVFEGDSEPSTCHWVAVHGSSAIVGVVSVMRSPQPVPHGEPCPQRQLRGMAVLSELQRSGIGRLLVEAVQHELAEPMWCNARARVVPFYERCGWRSVGPLFEIAPIGPHQRMIWTP